MSVSVPGISSGALPPINQANEPAAIRNGDAAAKKAYQVGLSFEQVFVDQLTQELASTVGGSSSSGSSDGSDGSDGSGDSSGANGLMGGDAASSAYANMLPQTLTSSIMSGGGTGIALQIAKSLDPALAHPVVDKTQGAKS
jgi:Rod binding domain-containing protein